MKKGLAILVVMAIISSCFVANAVSGEDSAVEWSGGFIVVGTWLVDYVGDGGDVVIPDGITAIYNYVFADYVNITSITIPDSVTHIGAYMVNGCTALVSLNIGNGISNIDKSWFWDCPSLAEINVKSSHANYSSLNGVLFNKNKTELIWYPEGKQNVSYCIPSSVKTISNNAFLRCKAIKSVSIPNSVVEIGFSAFWGCESLDFLRISSNVTTIRGGAFDEVTILSVFENSYAHNWAVENGHSYEVLSFSEVKELRDVLVLMLFIVNNVELSDEQVSAADLHEDGKIDAKDVLEALKMIVVR